MTRRMVCATAVLAAVGLTVTACGGSDDPTADATDDGGTASAVCDGTVEPGTVTVFAHEGSEAGAYQAAIDGFNSSVGEELGITAEVTFIPEGQYTDQVNAAAASNALPGVLDLDGPNMANLAWAGSLLPIDSCITDAELDNLLPSLIEQGTYADKLWAVGSFDSGLGLYAHRSALDEVGARIPASAEEAWTAEEFTQILRDLQAAGSAHPLDVKLWNGSQGEWYSYAFAPIVWSAGGDLIDRADYQNADGVLNSPEVVEAMTIFQGWVTEGLIDTSTVDDSTFRSGDGVLSWSGHWDYAANYEAIGEDLVLLPLPDFGTGSRTGMGSWAWGITPGADDPDAAWAVVSYLISDEAVLGITDVNSAVPATLSAIAQSENYQDGGPLELFVAQLEAAPDVATPRPVTPAYPAITMTIRSTIDDIVQGADVKSTLDAAVAEIDADIEANEGYPAP